MLDSLVLIFSSDYNSHKILSLFFISLGVLVSPVFDKLCNLVEIKFSVVGKIFLGTGLFFVIIICLGIDNLLVSVFVISAYWIIILLLKQKFQQKQRKQEKPEQEKLKWKNIQQKLLEKESLELLRLKNVISVKEEVKQQKLKQRQLEQEKLEKLKQEQLEQEKLENLKQEQLEQEKLEKLKQEQLEREKLEKLKQEQLEREKLEKLKQEQLEQKKQIIQKFDNLDIFIGHIIANMLAEADKIHKNCPENLYKINISDIVFDFCNDTRHFNNMSEFYDLSNNPNYYDKKISKHFSFLKSYIKDKILKTNATWDYKNQLIQAYPKILDRICNIIPSNTEAFLDEAVIRKNIDFTLDLNTGYGFYNYEYKNVFLYMMCLLLTGMCIAKLIFIEEKIKFLKLDSEFYIMISNMKKEFEDINLVIEKSKPIYDEFYKNDLGLIDSNSLLYNVAINAIVSKINDEKELDKDILKITDIKHYTAESLKKMMNSWIYEISKEHKVLEIEPYITYKILNSVSTSDFNLFLETLSKTNKYVENYNNCVTKHKLALDRERYLNGNFYSEKREISMLREFKYITSGQEFELFLEKLFKTLGYNTIHNGKPGDQGADLILQKNDCIYAIQAKYYTGKLSNTPIQEVVGSLKYYNANQGVVVTNSTFTHGAQELAKVNKVILIDGETLNYLINSVSSINKNIDILKQFEKIK